jgi:hypothetical protein
MSTFDEIIHVHRIERIKLQAWIEQRWVRPASTAAGYVFDEIDEARIALIQEMQGVFMVNDDALEMMLSLLDQLYATRKALRRIEEAMELLPQPIREQIKSVLQRQEPTE